VLTDTLRWRWRYLRRHGGITKSVPPREVMVGLPAKAMRDYKRNLALLNNVHKLYERVKTLEEKQ